MEETLEGGRGPPRAVAPLEREREREREIIKIRTSIRTENDRKVSAFVAFA
jgi:hypothetical protein